MSTFRVTFVVDVDGPVHWDVDQVLRRLMDETPWTRQPMQMSGDFGGHAWLAETTVAVQS